MPAAFTLEALADELAQDPAGLGYADAGLDERLALLNAANDPERFRTRPLTSAELLAWAAGNGRFVKLETAAGNAALGGELQSIAKAAHMLIQRDSTTLDLNLTDRQQMLGALVQAGVIGADDAAALAALARVPVGRAESLWGRPVTREDVERAS